MSKHEKEVQGVAVYLEFRKPNATVQVVITPDGLCNSGDNVAPAQLMRRQLAQGMTKRKWKSYSIRQVEGQKDALLYEKQIDDQQSLAEAVTRFKALDSYFAGLANNGYKLVNDTPIYVEVTKDDLDTTREGSMPAKLWTRIKSSRAALGFPEEIVSSF